MRLAVLAVPLAVLAAPVPAQEAAIEGVISDQIEAFRADDFARAFTFASPMIKGMFRTPDNFGDMVRNGYPMVHRPAEVRFGDLAVEDGRLRQRVILRDGTGAYHALDYEMIETADGWKINGVRMVPMPDVGV